MGQLVGQLLPRTDKPPASARLRRLNQGCGSTRLFFHSLDGTSTRRDPLDGRFRHVWRQHQDCMTNSRTREVVALDSIPGLPEHQTAPQWRDETGAMTTWILDNCSDMSHGPIH